MRNREIGSEFWDVPITEENNAIFNNDMDWYISGRSALRAIIEDIRKKKNVQTVAIPSWCCHTMVKPFIDEGIEAHFYPIYWRNSLIQEISLDSDVLFLMDYFGYAGEQPELNGYKGVVIRDVTHSIFSEKHSDADYYFGSLRKWCGVWTGGYAWRKDGHRLDMGMQRERCAENQYTVLREKAMLQKSEYINGQRSDKGYLMRYGEAERVLDSVGIAPAVDRDVQLTRRLDADGLKSRRRANAEVLRQAFSDWLIFRDMKDKDCPLFVPVLVPNGKRDSLRRYLIENEIYCPVHWPISECHRLDEREQFIYNNELSLVCDQRYTEEDMSRIVETINEFMEGVRCCSKLIQ